MAARKLGLEPEDALRGANVKFVRPFGFIELHPVSWTPR